MAKDFGQERTIRVYAAASAALGIVHRKGLGKVRHTDTNTLWVQQAACSKRTEYLKVAGTLNPADLLTKHLAQALKDQHCKSAGLVFFCRASRQTPELCKQ